MREVEREWEKAIYPGGEAAAVAPLRPHHHYYAGKALVETLVMVVW